MDFEQIKELIEIVNSSELAFFEINTLNEHIKMDKSFERNLNETNSNKSPSNKVQDVDKEKDTELDNESKIKQTVIKEGKKEDTLFITSPMVGTIYLKPSAESEEFVKVGDEICIGTPICIIEAMKLMNEIESEYKGTILSCLVKDGDMVEYGQPLFEIKGE